MEKENASALEKVYLPIIFRSSKCSRSNTDIVKLLLDVETDVNIQDDYGQTAFMQAVFRGETEIVEILLDADADISLKTNEGKTALDIVKEMGHDEIVIMLSEDEKD
ncbi:ankyrin repeat domain-containing protein [Longirhabdus pacifica]|uniref:ankyrin repeat domain-containing protein n=1 Tax=Longirhabdus pacifica TaxID=2305227 RepID=UPI0013E8C049|nr:ankyrin repeat domain-containing protein [Longirhabdus pacifica]